MIWSRSLGIPACVAPRLGGPVSEVPSRVVDEHAPVPLSIHFDDSINRDEPSVPGHPGQGDVETIPSGMAGSPKRRARAGRTCRSFLRAIQRQSYRVLSTT
jgi:hypothetical protein